MADNQGSHAYQKMKNRLFAVGLIVDVAFLLIFFFSGLSAQLKAAAGSISAHPVILNAVYVCFFSLILYVIHFPLGMFSGYIWEHRFKLSNQTFFHWVWDDLKKSILGLCIGLIIIEIVYIFLAKYPDHWWVFAGIFWLLLSFVLAKLTPNVLIPLFFKYSDLDNQELKKKIFELFKATKVSLKDVYAINFSTKTKKANAFVCGVGKSRRVVLSDTLISNFTVEEIETVVAHELAHYKHKDIVKLLCANAAGIFAGFYLLDKLLQKALLDFGLTRIDDISFLPVLLLAFMLFGLVVTPLTNAYSRFIETEADRFSLSLTNNPNGFIAMMEKLGKMNLAEFQPSRFIEWFFYDHPPIAKRIEFAKQFQGAN